ITRKNIYCFLSITSTKEPSFVSIYRQETGQTRILEGGEEKLVYRIKLGTKNNRYEVTNELPQSVPMKSSLNFIEVPVKVNKIEILEIFAGVKNSTYNEFIKVEFRDIPLSE
ncbi:MAG: hypothetical protein F6K14_34525, partial [Symploca sp. SIO2C1]|nr:hypothetical protein [Symploca sp. SIO2C1]